MKDVKLWLKEIQENESFAKKYKGLDNVKAIMNQAKKDGYEIKEKDLDEENLKKIAGGDLSFKFISQKLNMNISATGDHSEATNSSHIYFYGGS